MKRPFLILAMFGITALMAQAQSVTNIYSFGLSEYPGAGLTLGPDGKFYGTTSEGGSGGNYGTVFRVTTNGFLTPLVNFNFGNGAYPRANLTLGPDGSFYGTTYSGGSSGFGTVFKMTTNGSLTTLVNFNNANGAYPYAGLTLGLDGKFYGTTGAGGSHTNGTVFRVTTNGSLSTLVNFNITNGANPQASLALGPDGNFYGTTAEGGSSGDGTVFKINTYGNLTTLFNFSAGYGQFPTAGLTMGPDGYFYGTTFFGGNIGAGTVFKVSTNGSLTTLVDFNDANGSGPDANLTLAPDGNLYGTTEAGGANGNYGTVFEVTTDGTLATLASFANTNGFAPRAGLTLGPDGNFYGTTDQGGHSSLGNIYRLNLPPNLSAAGTNQVILQGGNAEVTLTPFGTPPFTFEWLSGEGTVLSGSTGNFTVTNVSLMTLSDYWVIITNAYGTYVLFLSDLNIPQPPGFTSQPQSQTVVNGSSAVFSGLAVGSLPLAYQWYFNNSPLAGATNLTLALDPAGTNEVGNYQLLVANAYGSVTSQVATLSVLLQMNLNLLYNSSSGHITFHMSSYPNTTNRLWATTNLQGPAVPWTVIATNVTDAKGIGRYLDPNAGGPQKYYRLSIP